MSHVLTRIQRLIALAANTSAEPAEARTAAHIAARLIHGHRIELRDPPEREAGAVPTKVIHSRYDGRCNHCGRDYHVGELVVWSKGRGAAHVMCVEA